MVSPVEASAPPISVTPAEDAAAAVSALLAALLEALLEAMLGALLAIDGFAEATGSSLAAAVDVAPTVPTECWEWKRKKVRESESENKYIHIYLNGGGGER